MPQSSPAPAAALVPLLSFKSFIRFWFARLFGTAGNQMLMVAIGWQMYDLTGSAWDLGLVGLLQFVPALLLTLVAGHVADRYERARIMALCMVLQALVSGVLMIASLGHIASRELLLILSVVLGTAKAFQMPAQQALVPLLVPQDVLPRALAFSSGGMQAAVIAGPALGGFIYVAGPAAVQATCTALFIIAAVLALMVKHTHAPMAREPVTMKTLFAGVTYIRQREVVLGAISLDLFAVLLGGATALLPIYAKDVLHTGPWGLGLLRGAPAIGALLTSVWLTRRPLQRKVGHRMFAAVAIFGLATLVFALSTSFIVSLAALAVSGAADMVSVVIRQSLVQLETPNEMRGRVSAVNSVFIGASNQLGEFESGATAALFGPVGSVVIGGLGTLFIAALWMRLFPALARRDSLTQAAPPASAASPAVARASRP